MLKVGEERKKNVDRKTAEDLSPFFFHVPVIGYKFPHKAGYHHTTSSAGNLNRKNSKIT